MVNLEDDRNQSDGAWKLTEEYVSPAGTGTKK